MQFFYVFTRWRIIQQHREGRVGNEFASLTSSLRSIRSVRWKTFPTWQRNENSYSPSEIGRKVAIVLVRDLKPQTAAVATAAMVQTPQTDLGAELVNLDFDPCTRVGNAFLLNRYVHR